MTLQQLEYVLAIDRHKNFSRAAEHCGVTQPTLSAMIQKLEDELGIKLFDRSVQPIATTLMGSRIVAQAQQVLKQASLIPEMVAEAKETVSGTFRIAVLPTIAPYLLPRFFTGVQRDYPDLSLQVVETLTADIRRALAAGEIDAAILADLGDEAAVDMYSLYYEAFFVYVSESEPLFSNDTIRSADITGERLWLLDEGHCFRDQLVRFCRMERVRANQSAYRLGSMETFMHMVERGNGMTFIPALAVEQFDAERKRLVRPFAIPRPTRHIVLITRPDYVRKHIINIFVERIRASVPPHMLTLQSAQTLV